MLSNSLIKRLASSHETSDGNSFVVASRLNGLLHLRQYKWRASGFSIVEIVISTVILGVATAAAVKLFNTYSLFASRARAQDAISTLINKDIEKLRFVASNVLKGTPPGGSCPTGATCYAPSATDCSSNQIATAVQLAATPDLTTGNQTIARVNQDTTVSRNISIRTTNKNIFVVDYESSGDVNSKHTIYILPPQHSWCP